MKNHGVDKMVIKKKKVIPKKELISKKIEVKKITENEIPDNTQDSITDAIDIIENEENDRNDTIRDENSLPEAIKALADALFKDNHIKMGKLSGENKKGMTTITVINTFFGKRFGYSFYTLESLKEDCMNRNISIDAFGIASLVEAMKSITMSIESSPDATLINRLLKR